MSSINLYKIDDAKVDVFKKALMLKNKLDQWKKEVRLQGLKPIIYVNYKT